MIKTSLKCMICYEIWEERSSVRNHQRNSRSVAGYGFMRMFMMYLSEQNGAQAVEGLVLKLAANAKCFSTKAFENMKKLRLLHLAGVQLDGDFKYLSRNLRWLCWNGFPLTFIPADFYQRNLVSIELENSNIKFLWKEMQRLENLKFLNLSHSHCLVQTPDFSNMPNLEKLILKDCPRLSEVSHTTGHLHKGLMINLKDCISLPNLPRTMYTLKSLRTLILWLFNY